VKVVIPDNPDFRPFDYERERLGALGVQVAFCGVPEGEIARAAADAEVLFDTSHPLSRATLERLPRLRLIAFYGIGTDFIDVPAATELGIVVTNAPLYGTNEVADHAVTLLLACSRRLRRADQVVRRGDWDWSSFRPLHSLAVSTVGVVGFGNIGRAFGRRMLAFGCRVLYHDPYVPEAPFEGAIPAPLQQLLREADYVSLHVPRTAESVDLIGARELALMKPTAFLVNTGRGAVVDQPALVQVLQQGRIAGAGLDVFAEEPLPPDHPLLALDNVILTPHWAGYSEEAWDRQRVVCCDAAEHVLRGEWPDNVVNPRVQPQVPLRPPST
jgi:D-3-phosphoglycerate dehydrogenase